VAVLAMAPEIPPAAKSAKKLLIPASFPIFSSVYEVVGNLLFALTNCVCDGEDFATEVNRRDVIAGA
jgi:hypothetical protein